MCPFCIASAVSIALWSAAGTAATGGISALVITKFRSNINKNRQPGASHEEQQ